MDARENTEVLSSGTIVDRYEIDRVIGQGGMATVYAVKHTLLGSRHAMKVLLEVHSGVGESLLQEGRLQARLDPNYVVPVTDVVMVDGVPALVMPLVEGCTLEDLLRSYEPAPGEVASIMDAIVRGIASAHENGIAHRDLKPSNVLLDVKHGRVRVRVADFGLARGDQESGAIRSDLFMGTPEYAAPEQFSDPSAVDGKADLWAIGTILYHMTVGEMAFTGDSPSAIYRTLCTEGAKVHRMPELWRDLATELLERDPQRRGPEARNLPERLGKITSLAPLVGGTSLSEAIHRAGENALKRMDSMGSQGPRTTVSGTDKKGTNRGLKQTRIGSGTGKKRAQNRRSSSYIPGSSQFTAMKKHGLPVSRDAFIGRVGALEDLHASMMGARRLVTVLGMGGSGKTRLAIRYGWDHLDRWPGGVWFCDLTEVQAVDGICVSLAATLGVPLSEGDAIEQLGHVLSSRGRALIIFDNFEHVVESGEATIGKWMASCPDTVFMVTSRTVLGLPGETHLHLSPMESHDSVELFLDRAQRARPNYTPTPGERDAIEELVGLLDNLPLAIELAAARIRILTPSKMLARVSDRFKLLTSRGGKKESKATLRGTLDWSWNLLTEWEQDALTQLSVFEGGFDLEAVEGILDLASFEDAPWPMDTVQSLVDKSLVRTVGDDRFDLLVSVREYAAEYLGERDEAGGAQRRHGAYFADYGTQEAIESLHRKNGDLAREALFLEFDNLLVALNRGIARGDADVVTPVLRALLEVFEKRGPISLAVELAGRVLDAVPLSPEQRGMVYLIRGCAQRLMGDYHGCITSFGASLEVGRDGEDRRLEGQALAWLGRSLIRVGRVEEAAQAIRDAEVLAQETQATVDMAMVFHHRAIYRSQVGENLESVADYMEGLRLARQCGDEAMEVRILTGMGQVESESGMLEEGRAHLKEALALVQRLEDPRYEGVVRGDLGILFHWHGEPKRGLRQYDVALKLARKVGNRRDEAINLVNKGDVHYLIGEREEARRYLEEAVPLGKETWPLVAGASLGTLGLMDAQDGDLKKAHRSIEEGEPYVRNSGYKLEVGKFLAKKAQVMVLSGRQEEAQACYGEAKGIYGELGSHEKALEYDLEACEKRGLTET